MIIRDAVAADASILAEVAIMAGHGIMTMFYGDLVPGKTVAQTFVDRRILNPKSHSALHHWRVAEDEDRKVLGAINCLPQSALMAAEPDPLLVGDRVLPVAELSELEELAVDSYYINLIAVFPQHRRSGAGRALVAEAERLARQERMTKLSLCTYEADASVMSFYESLGFRVRERRSIRANPFFPSSGNFVLLTRELSG
ncbi:MAG TPA: GNAT family N-acetyltransferase [Dongiaceae bacterium]|nr:GNAT family N-acetyltransferase [Dongiaceae bacterium]